jgi:midasin
VLLERTSSVPFGQAFGRFLRPALHDLIRGQQSRQRSIFNLGLSWIALSRAIIDLYVPNAPIDPAAVQNCTVELWHHEEAVISEQIHLHSRFEQVTTGNDSNVILSHLKEQLYEASEQLATISALPMLSRHDVSRLHMFWSEVLQFQNQVISSSRIDPLLLLFESGDASAPLREQVIQQSITGFCQRLDVVYPDYDDINAPLQLALLHMKLGLRLIAHSVDCDSDDISNSVGQVCMALVAFPSVRSSSLLHGESEVSDLSGVAVFWRLLLNLASIGFEKSLGVDMETSMPLIETTYGQALRLWLIDRAREDQEDEASQSLYRRKPLDYDAIGDAEAEEREFIALFPSFENALEQETGSHTEPNQRSFLVDATQLQQLVDIHHNLMNASSYSSDSTSDAPMIFSNIRRLTLHSLLESQMASLSDILDVESLVFQSSILRDHISELQGIHKPAGRLYNFYVDANFSEVSKAAALVEGLKTYLDTLIQEWPDQMVLHSLKGRCDDLLNLSLRSPIAKVLASLEQLLMQSEDWEMYANRQNTLKEHQQALTALIVDWRRLELSSWQALLQSQAKSFADGASEWWFRLYDAIVRGPLDVIDQEHLEGSETQTDYLAKLIPLLDDFIRSSPLGQYNARMQLLHSFEHYISYLAPTKTDHQRLTLGRVQRVLHSTLMFYGLFSAQISAHLSHQRVALEKEIRGFIKLASWKDVNVHALKASAQRTHHQLYKSIRKFREIMRQPIATRLQPEPAGEEDLKYLQLDPISHHPITSELPSLPSGDTASDHLLDLNRTFKRFDLLITGPIRTFIRSRSAHVVDSLAVEIISTAKALASVLILNDVPAEKQEKQQKALLVRKRKALSDLLKELKRCGLFVNVKPEILSQQMDPLWIRDQPIIPEVNKLSMPAQKCESYMNRLHDSLPRLRMLLSGHHSDLTTRELQRGVMFLESGYSMAFNTRSWYVQNVEFSPEVLTLDSDSLAGALNTYQKLEDMSHRLRMIFSTSKIALSNSKLLERILYVKNSLCKLANAFNDISNGLEVFRDLQPNRSLPASTIQQAQTMNNSTKALCDQVEVVVNNVRLTSFPVLLEGALCILFDFIC